MEGSSSPRTGGGNLHLIAILALGGALVGAAESMYHHSGPMPMGHPPWGGASPIAMMGLQAALVAAPAAAMILLSWAGRKAVKNPRPGSGKGGDGSGREGPSGGGVPSPAVVTFAAVLPTVWVDLDHLARFSHWPLMSYHRPALFAVEVAVLAGTLSAVVAWAAVRALRRWSSWSVRSRNGRRTAWAVMTVVAALMVAAAVQLALPKDSAAGGSGKAQTGRVARSQGLPSSDAPNLLLFTIDTLRRDAVGAYGGPSTPGLDGWIDRGVRCQAWTSSPWTRPTFASIFSAVAPTGHGADRHRPVAAEVAWWPEILQQRGWETRAWVCNPHLEAGLGFARGFDHFDHSSQIGCLQPVSQMLWVRWLHRHLSERRDRGDRIIRRACRWFRERPEGPWFVWVHVVDPHMPYHLRGPHGESDDPHPGEWLDPLRPFLQDGAVRDVAAIRAAADTLGAGARSALEELYRREVLFLDRQVAGLLEAAEMASADRPLLWVIASDHGEEFFEHGGFEHGHTLYGELLRVPLAFGGDGLPAHGWASGFKLEDIGPTLFSLLDLPPIPRWGRAAAAVDSVLVPLVFGLDRSERLRQASILPGGGEGSPSRRDDGPCDPPPMVVEDLLYGPPHTRLILDGGHGVLRDDERIRFARIDACGPLREIPETMDAAELSVEERAIFDALDRWRAAAARIPHPEVSDPALRARLRTLGYVE